MNIEELNKKRAEVEKAKARFNAKNVARAAKEAEADRKREADLLDQEMRELERVQDLQDKAAKQGGVQTRDESVEDEAKRLLKAAKLAAVATGGEGTATPNLPTTSAPANGSAAKSEEK